MLKNSVFVNDELVVNWLVAFTLPAVIPTIKKIEAEDKLEVIADLSEMASELASHHIVKEALVEAASAYGKAFSFADFAKGTCFTTALKRRVQQTVMTLRLHQAALHSGCLTKEAVKTAFEFYIMAVLLIFFWDQK